MEEKFALNIANVNAEELIFLKESNAIEGVFDLDSLQQSIWAWEYIRNVKALTIGNILKTQKIIMLHSKLRPDEKGYLRTKEVRIGRWDIVGVDPSGDKLLKEFTETGKVLDAKDVRKGLEDWLVIANSDDISEEWCKQTHVMYEHIHPFMDGNGRTGRMFMNWQRLRAGLPLLIIMADEKKKYYEWFKMEDSTNGK